MDTFPKQVKKCAPFPKTISQNIEGSWWKPSSRFYIRVIKPCNGCCGGCKNSSGTFWPHCSASTLLRRQEEEPSSPQVCVSSHLPFWTQMREFWFVGISHYYPGFIERARFILLQSYSLRLNFPIGLLL